MLSEIPMQQTFSNRATFKVYTSHYYQLSSLLKFDNEIYQAKRAAAPSYRLCYFRSESNSI